jgi:hypothetical protein
MIKGIHLALEVETSFGNSTPMRVLARNPAVESLDFPLIAVIDITERERKRNMHTKKLQSKA